MHATSDHCQNSAISCTIRYSTIQYTTVKYSTITPRMPAHLMRVSFAVSSRDRVTAFHEFLMLNTCLYVSNGSRESTFLVGGSVELKSFLSFDCRHPIPSVRPRPSATQQLLARSLSRSRTGLGSGVSWGQPRVRRSLIFRRGERQRR